MAECTFCDQFLSHKSHGICGEIFGSDFRREIYEDKHFVVVAALGQIIEGCLLIIPRMHYYSISALPNQIQDNFREITERVRERLRKDYGSAILLEHGSVTQMGCAGACIEHAHLHAVPINIDIKSIVSTSFRPILIPSLKDLWSSPPNKDYLYYESTNSECFLFEPEKPLPCQYFRRIVAAAIGCPNDWDWRTHIGTQKVRSVTKKLEGRI